MPSPYVFTRLPPEMPVPTSPQLTFDLPAGRVRADRVRQLLGERHGRRKARQPRTVGHGGTGGL